MVTWGHAVAQPQVKRWSERLWGTSVFGAGSLLGSRGHMNCTTAVGNCFHSEREHRFAQSTRPLGSEKAQNLWSGQYPMHSFSANVA